MFAKKLFKVRFTYILPWTRLLDSNPCPLGCESIRTTNCWKVLSVENQFVSKVLKHFIISDSSEHWHYVCAVLIATAVILGLIIIIFVYKQIMKRRRNPKPLDKMSLIRRDLDLEGGRKLEGNFLINSKHILTNFKLLFGSFISRNSSWDSKFLLNIRPNCGNLIVIFPKQ